MTFDQERAIQRLTRMPLFPFEGEFKLKDLTPLMDAEYQRSGEGDSPCNRCSTEDGILWRKGPWTLAPIFASANPVGLFLETVDHIDFEDFDDEMAADYGIITRHLEAAIRAQSSVGRVHIHRYADGSSHFHVWFQGRPARQLELYGWGNNVWAQVLPPLPQDVIDAHHAAVLEAFVASYGGELV